jgi:alcohol dehydrogenase (NADP+)
MNKTIKLNNNEIIPALGLGTWHSDKDKVGQAVKTALIKGYQHIDCASIYGNEEEIGEAFNSVFSAGHVKREDIFVTSKLWNADHHPDNVEKACKKTLSDLQFDYLDLFIGA